MKHRSQHARGYRPCVPSQNEYAGDGGSGGGSPGHSAMAASQKSVQSLSLKAIGGACRMWYGVWKSPHAESGE